MGLILLVQRAHAALQHGGVSQGGMIRLLGLQNGLQLVIIQLTVNGVYQFAANLLARIVQQRLKNVGSHRLVCLRNLSLSFLFQQGPVVSFGRTVRTLHAPVLFSLGVSLGIEGSGYNKVAHLPFPRQWISAQSLVFTAILQQHSIPGLVALLLPGILHRQDLERFVLFQFPAVVLLLLATRLPVATLLVEAEQNPGQLIRADRLAQGLGAEVIERPVVGYLSTPGHPLRITLPEGGHHLVEGVTEEELVVAVGRFAPGYFGFGARQELAVAVEAAGVVRRQIVHHLQHAQQALPPQMRPLNHAAHLAESRALGGL
ncbi:unknown [Prevotella sp. CAG:617]|nr:unknown [Prevotella sp. CAG:617]